MKKFFVFIFYFVSLVAWSQKDTSRYYIQFIDEYENPVDSTDLLLFYEICNRRDVHPLFLNYQLLYFESPNKNGIIVLSVPADKPGSKYRLFSTKYQYKNSSIQKLEIGALENRDTLVVTLSEAKLTFEWVEVIGYYIPLLDKGHKFKKPIASVEPSEEVLQKYAAVKNNNWFHPDTTLKAQSIHEVTQKIKYPNDAIQHEIQDFVVYKLSVNCKGEVLDITLHKDADPWFVFETAKVLEKLYHLELNIHDTGVCYGRYSFEEYENPYQHFTFDVYLPIRFMLK